MRHDRNSPFAPGWLRLGLALWLATLAAFAGELFSAAGALSIGELEQRQLPGWLAAHGTSFARLITGRWPDLASMRWVWGGGLAVGSLAALWQLGPRRGGEWLLLCACAGMLLRLHGPRPSELAGLWPLALGSGLILAAERRGWPALALELAGGWLLLAALAEAQRHGIWTGLGALFAVAMALGQRCLPPPAVGTARGQ